MDLACVYVIPLTRTLNANLIESICLTAVVGVRAWRTFSIRATILRGGMRVGFLAVKLKRVEVAFVER